MALHRSLKVDPALAQQRSVLSRIERIKDLMKKGLWAEGQAVTGLPKTKIIKIKAKKAVKEAVPAEGAAGTTEAAPAAGATAPASTPQAAGAPAAKTPKAK